MKTELRDAIEVTLGQMFTYVYTDKRTKGRYRIKLVTTQLYTVEQRKAIEALPNVEKVGFIHHCGSSNYGGVTIHTNIKPSLISLSHFKKSTNYE